MSRYARRKDRNHPAIVGAFVGMGCTVEVHEPSTTGAPDLIVGVAGINLLIEVKPDVKAKDKRELRDTQREWHEGWRGQVAVVRTVDDVVTLVNRVRGSMTRHDVAQEGM